MRDEDVLMDPLERNDVLDFEPRKNLPPVPSFGIAGGNESERAVDGRETDPERLGCRRCFPSEKIVIKLDFFFT